MTFIFSTLKEKFQNLALQCKNFLSIIVIFVIVNGLQFDIMDMVLIEQAKKVTFNKLDFSISSQDIFRLMIMILERPVESKIFCFCVFKHGNHLDLELCQVNFSYENLG